MLSDSDVLGCLMSCNGPSSVEVVSSVATVEPSGSSAPSSDLRSEGDSFASCVPVFGVFEAAAADSMVSRLSCSYFFGENPVLGKGFGAPVFARLGQRLKPCRLSRKRSLDLPDKSWYLRRIPSLVSSFGSFLFCHEENLQSGSPPSIESGLSPYVDGLSDSCCIVASPFLSVLEVGFSHLVKPKKPKRVNNLEPPIAVRRSPRLRKVAA